LLIVLTGLYQVYKRLNTIHKVEVL
jgi:hypothetical protein